MYGLIVNTAAGGGKGRRMWRKIEQELQKQGLPCLVAFTAKPADATKLAAMLVENGAETIVIIGGDGTVSEAAEALVFTGVPLGIIPAGSGNDFARSQGIPKQADAALKIVLAGNERTIDVLQIAERYGLTVAGIGIDAQVAQTVNETGYKQWFNAVRLGRLTYFACVFQALKTFRPAEVTVTIDGEKQRFSHAWLIAVANSPTYGGNIPICPEAICDDGRLDVCLLQSKTAGPLLRLLPKIVRGKHAANDHIHFFSGTHAVIEADPPLRVQSDGEYICETPVQVNIIKNALTVIS
ncbi:diacylglycerol/lipid kinase family protein [Salisediminibacterium halotolerans]|uniref:diacylglycerol/lipid kinase family protein n=1 Tax=Salisediminibacterium halotolerans TaxID=517425 RepID=UPI000EAEAD89|nr:diacylglycerol kinase family protein [Salisediminibacterium halotolerans]RLJ72254.1 YegS/Rv2252/BmrU family lipid kinase [Actinophytocola xinjiangensis]RPE85468.1 YegS/Rv2252/BmrU family lipid kinase [Salisediminibacterium halotolerans]TWG33423.1 YegS/Rv2252/BmrU family lipid kinase [Salisediminibacterium halotolerans]GEL07035.1 diacylglycerol kinase [Salisediminibacterium halotolerans]